MNLGFDQSPMFELPDEVRHPENPALRGCTLGQKQALSAAIEPPEGAVGQQLAVARNRNAVDVGQAPREVLSQIGRRETRSVEQNLGGSIEPIEMVVARLHPVPHLLVRRERPRHRGHSASLRCLQLLGLLAIRPVEKEQPAAELRRRLCRDLELGKIHPAAAEQWIGQCFAEVLYPAQLLALSEVVDADSQHVAEPMKDSARQGSLVALDLVEVAGRYAHRPGKRRLAHPGAFP